MSRSLLAIDPGKSGGIAVYHDHLVTCRKMAETPVELWEVLESLCISIDPVAVYIENVGFHRVGNSASSSVKFSRHVGMLEGMFIALRCSIVWVAPGTWMGMMGSLPKDVGQRKNMIKHRVSERFRHLTVTLAVADALGIMWYALKKHQIAGY